MTFLRCRTAEQEQDAAEQEQDAAKRERMETIQAEQEAAQKAAEEEPVQKAAEEEAVRKAAEEEAVSLPSMLSCLNSAVPLALVVFRYASTVP